METHDVNWQNNLGISDGWHLIDKRQIAKYDSGVIATAWHFGNKGTVSQEEAEANARLISRAPQLLYGLIWALQFFKHSDGPRTTAPQLVKAIEGATGKTWEEVEEAIWNS